MSHFEFDYLSERGNTVAVSTPFQLADKLAGGQCEWEEGYPIRGEWMMYRDPIGRPLWIRLLQQPPAQ